MSEPRVSFAAGTDLDAALAEAEALFRRDGVVVLDHVADPALLADALAQIEVDYPSYADTDPARNFGFYPGRHTTPLVIAGALANREVFLPRSVVQLARKLLGKGPELDSFGLLVSLPGAEDQTPHPDALLFSDQGTDCLLPPFAFALVMPLVAMDRVSGSTAFWRGSHRKPQVTGEPDFAPEIQPGSALLWDFRVVHRGLANRSAAPRPVLFSVLCREWWREKVSLQATRYEKLCVARAAWDQLAPGAQAIACRATITDTARATPHLSLESQYAQN